MKLLLDTSAISAFGSGDKKLERWFSGHHELLVPLVVVGELRAGFALGTKQHENETQLQKFLDSSHVRTVTLTDKTTGIFATIFRQLRRAGTPIGLNDIWIAALTQEHQATLVTLDADFKHIKGLKLASHANK